MPLKNPGAAQWAPLLGMLSSQGSWVLSPNPLSSSHAPFSPVQYSQVRLLGWLSHQDLRRAKRERARAQCGEAAIRPGAAARRRGSCGIETSNAQTHAARATATPTAAPAFSR